MQSSPGDPSYLIDIFIFEVKSKDEQIDGITLKAFLMKTEHDFCQKTDPAFHWNTF